MTNIPPSNVEFDVLCVSTNLNVDLAEAEETYEFRTIFCWKGLRHPYRLTHEVNKVIKDHESIPVKFKFENALEALSLSTIPPPVE